MKLGGEKSGSKTKAFFSCLSPFSFLDASLRHARAMPTPGTHTPDVTYQPSTDMAWGARGNERMKSASDREYEQRVRNRQRRCSIVPTAPRRVSILDVAFQAQSTMSTVSNIVRWLFNTLFFVHRKMFGMFLVVLGHSAPGKPKGFRGF